MNDFLVLGALIALAPALIILGYVQYIIRDAIQQWKIDRKIARQIRELVRDQ